MAYKRTSNKKEAKNEWKQVPDMVGFTVIGDRDRFSLSFEVCEGMRIGINGCRVFNGKNGPFISYPAWKDKSNSYHNYCYITLTDEEIQKIISVL